MSEWKEIALTEAKNPLLLTHCKGEEKLHGAVHIGVQRSLSSRRVALHSYVVIPGLRLPP